MARTTLILLAATVACTPDYGMTSFAGPGEMPVTTTPETTVPEVTTSTTTTPTTPDDPAPEDDCDNTSDLIYVIDRSDEGLYLFDPLTGDFNYLFTLNCTMWGSPGSMAVARDGAAYVRYSDNTIYKVNLTSGTCSQTNYNAGFGSFGMGFATDSAGTWMDQLYIANSDDLAALDTGDWSLDLVGGMPSQSELTGNAAGELWAFLPLEEPAALIHIDQTNGDRLTRLELSNFAEPTDIDAFAFATWGGDFYLFVRLYGMGNTTDVLKVDASGNMTTFAADTGMDVVGAGVSTCAPTE